MSYSDSVSIVLFVQVGFLRSLHRYEIVFNLPQVPSMSKDATLSPALRTSAKPRLRATRITPRQEGTCQLASPPQRYGPTYAFNKMRTGWNALVCITSTLKFVTLLTSFCNYLCSFSDSFWKWMLSSPAIFAYLPWLAPHLYFSVSQS